MKKSLCILLAVLLSLAVVCPVAATKSLAYGDPNGDNAVNAADALMALKAAVKKVTLTAEQQEAADVDDNNVVNAADALLILKYAVKKITSFPAEDNQIPDPTPVDDKSMDEIITELERKTPASAISDGYAAHADGGMIYNPLSRELSQEDKTKYNVAPKTKGSLALSDGTTLNYSLPTDVTAYDLIPVEYSLSGISGNNPVYVEATTFEDKNGSYYDLCLPGTVSLKFDYLGYVSANDDVGNRPFLSRSLNDDIQGKQYPQYQAGDLVPSDTVEKATYVWFKFRVTNTGNTILDGDGNGTFCFYPFFDDDGVGNRHVRLTEDLYPGESTDLWFYFGNVNSGNKLSVGDHTISIGCLVRNEQSGPDWSSKIWDGYKYGVCTKDISIKEGATITQKSAATYRSLKSATRNTWLHKYEEFTTSFDSWLAPSTSGCKPTGTQTLYVQPAAWSDHVALKLMRGNSLNMKSVNIPLKVDTASVNVKVNTTADNYIVTDEGTKYPAIAAQSMCDMRVNINNGPDADMQQLDELLDMKECGVNLISTTEAFNISCIKKAPTSPNNSQDSNFFMCDCVRELGMRLEGFTGYTYDSGTTMQAAYWYANDRSMNVDQPGIGNSLLAKANGLRGLYQFMRWGNNFYVNSKGKPVFNTEDTRGWMRIDYNARMTLDTDTVNDFRQWLKQKYGTIAKLNKAWGNGLNYSSFDEIDPEEGTRADHSWRGYNTSTATFYEWTEPVNDLDIFRTLHRTQEYATVLDTLKNYNTNVKDIGAASVDGTMSIRTEGGNVTGVVRYNEGRSHLRHTYYSQRRCAIIPEILSKSGTVSMHSDYVTLPYTPGEWARLVASSTALGITEMPLIQSNRMRDIAINAKVGDDFSIHYNLSGDMTRGAYINTQTSVFEVFKAIYENGGIPGVLWEDYLCDGYVTETQQKEMKFYSSKIAEAMQTEEAKKWATTNVQDVKAVYSTAKANYSYPKEYIQAEIQKALKLRSGEQAGASAVLFNNCETLKNGDNVAIVANPNSSGYSMQVVSSPVTQGSGALKFTVINTSYSSDCPMMVRAGAGVPIKNITAVSFDLYLSNGIAFSGSPWGTVALQSGFTNSVDESKITSLALTPYLAGLKAGWNHVEIPVSVNQDTEVVQITIRPGGMTNAVNEYMILDNVTYTAK